MNSKSGEEQKKGHRVRTNPNFDSNSDTEQKRGQNDDVLALGQVSIITRPSPSNALIILGRVLDSYSDSNEPIVLSFGRVVKREKNILKD